jgi:hypothetical protein
MARQRRKLISTTKQHKGINAMTDIELQTLEETLTFDVSDAALEIAAGARSEQLNFTLGACTGLSVCPA